MVNECITISCHGLSCDNLDDCTMDDQYDAQCICIGVLIDLDQNGECDLYEECESDIVISTLMPDSNIYLANQSIILDIGEANNMDSMVLSASNSIIFMEGVAI